MLNITPQVQSAVSKSKIKNGICVVYCPHTTAGIIVNENADADVAKDLLNAFEAVVPNIKFHHAEGNSDAHFKSVLAGHEKTFAVERGELVLGVWQGIFFAEFDGPRERKIIVKVFSD